VVIMGVGDGLAMGDKMDGRREKAGPGRAEGSEGAGSVFGSDSSVGEVTQGIRATEEW
jgi:hypothetical protein